MGEADAGKEFVLFKLLSEEVLFKSVAVYIQ